MLRGLLKLLNAEIVFGFLIASVFWIGILGWQAAYTPSEIEKRQCEESARRSGHKTEECKTLWERTTTDPVAFFTFWLVVSTVGLGISTSLLWVAGEKQFDFLTRNATAQSIDTRNSIAEASRAATAMENVATGIAASAKAAQESVATLRERTAAQMRPYLTVLIGTGVYQEREKNLKFEVKPVLINSGHTPAHNVTYRARAAVFDNPLPANVVLNDPDEIVKSAFVLGPQQNIVLNAFLNEFLDDERSEAVKRGKAERVYIWGIVSYEDAFGERHETKFCHSLYWVLVDGKELIFGHYAPRHNEAN